MIRRLLIVSLASLTLGGCITYSGDGYYSAPGNAYSGYGEDDGYYGSPGYYGDYSYGNVPRVSISFSFGYGYPYYGYPSYYGYSRCSAWSPYCFGGFYPNYGYGWGGYWPVYGYNHHHHHHPDKPKPNPSPPDDSPDGTDWADDGTGLPGRPGHTSDYPIGIRPGRQKPQQVRQPARPVTEAGDTQPIAVGDTPVARPLPAQQRPRRMPLPIIIEDGREPEFRRADWIPPQTPIRQPVQQRPIPVESDDGDYVRSNRPSRNTPIRQGQPDRPPNVRQPMNAPPAPPPQMAPPRAPPPARVRAEAPPHEPKAKTVHDDGDER